MHVVIVYVFARGHEVAAGRAERRFVRVEQEVVFHAVLPCAGGRVAILCIHAGIDVCLAGQTAYVISGITFVHAFTRPRYLLHPAWQRKAYAKAGQRGVFVKLAIERFYQVRGFDMRVGIYEYRILHPHTDAGAVIVHRRFHAEAFDSLILAQIGRDHKVRAAADKRFAVVHCFAYARRFPVKQHMEALAGYADGFAVVLYGDCAASAGSMSMAGLLYAQNHFVYAEAELILEFE